jgi:hypothetical protein
MMDNVRVDRWATGGACALSPFPYFAALNGAADGPVISQTDLYLLKPNLQIHPILTKSHNFILIFNLLTGASLVLANQISKTSRLLFTREGYTGGFNEQQTDRDHPFEQANQPATLPRVSVMHIVTERSPWCTTIRNESGVTLGDICGQMHKE